MLAKYRQLSDRRFSKLRLVNGQIHAWTKDSTPTELLEHLSRNLPSSKIVSIQTHVDDDQIEGYRIIVDVDGLIHYGNFMALEAVMKDALSFWERRLPIR